MQSMPGSIAEGDSQARVQVGPLVDKGQPVSQSLFAGGTASSTGPEGWGRYDMTQVHLRVSQSLLWAGPCPGRTGLDMMHTLPLSARRIQKASVICLQQPCPQEPAAGIIVPEGCRRQITKVFYFRILV